jgi:hypothetical protein
MQRCRKVFPISLILIFVALAAKSQVASSPFSKFGIGDLSNNGLAQNQGMGGVGISNPSPLNINNQNPALLVFNRVTVFQGGLQIERRAVSDGTNSQNFASGNMNYLAMAFPVVPLKWTTAIGIMPYSHVNYKLSYSDIATGSNIPVTRTESGTGGINQFYWSNGVKINKYFSLGVKASYLFSSIVTQDVNTFSGSTGAYPSVYVRDYFNGLNFTGGISFHKDSLFDKNYRLNIGAVYSAESRLNTQHFVRYESKLNSGATIDSSTVVNNAGGKTRIPQNFGIGVSFGKVDKWTLGGDFTYLDFKRFNGYTNSVGTPTVGYRSGIGFEIIPDATDYTNYLNRMVYRLGATYERSPYLINGNSLTDIAGTFGFSLPVGRMSTLDLGFKIGKRGTVAQNSIEEDYFRVYFGITFNDQWFIKRKFD